jgi:hypothetical protein
VANISAYAPRFSTGISLTQLSKLVWRNIPHGTNQQGLYKLNGLFAVDDTASGVLLKDFVVQGIGQVWTFALSSGSEDCKEQYRLALSKVVGSARDIYLRVLGI